jgi:hypothetical protein
MRFKKPLKAVFRREIEYMPSGTILDSFKKNFENSYCDHIEIVNNNRLIVKNEFFRIKPDMNWNLWCGIGKAEIVLFENPDKKTIQIEYTIDFSRMFVSFCFSICFIILIIAYSTSNPRELLEIISYFYVFLFIAFLLSICIAFLRHRSIFLKALFEKPESLGNYNWIKILSEKSDYELTEISLGKTHLPEAISELARQEIKKRNITRENK